MFLFRVVFWVVVVGFFFSGGSFEPGKTSPSSNPAHQTADRVMAATHKLSQICETHQSVCTFAGEAGEIATDFMTYMTGRVHDWLQERSDDK